MESSQTQKKVCIITGATCGIGKDAIFKLVKLNELNMHYILAARSQSSCINIDSSCLKKNN
jgi:short-subunit dehydrogenase